MALSSAQARRQQEQLAGRVSRKPGIRLKQVRTIAGADVSYEKKAVEGYAAIVVCSFPSLEILEIGRAEGHVDFPYIPGLLTYRELPLLEKAWNQLKQKPDIMVCDGQGYAHPRRIGLASHVGVVLGVPTVGCAKSRLVGEYEEPGPDRGDRSSLWHEGQIIGRVLRTRDGVKPLYVSVGTGVNLRQAESLVLNLCRHYRQPEVIRMAHREVNRLRMEHKK
jgi:deoxyribonuclease V